MGVTRVDGGEWALGNIGKTKPEKPARKLAGIEVDPRAVEDVVDFLSEAPKTTQALRESIATVAGNTRLALGSGLNKRALLLLVQDLTPKLRNGDQVSLSTIEGVITAMANLDQFLVKK